MLIMLTLENGNEMVIDAGMVKLVHRAQGGLFLTAITTSFMTPQGPMVYVVKENPKEVMELVNKALRP